MISLYKKFDSWMMNMANKAVYAWNYTTGGTKKSLANILAGTALLFEVSGLMMADPKFAPFLGTILVSVTMGSLYRNMQQEELEDELIKNRTKVPLYFEHMNSELGPLFLGSSAVCTASSQFLDHKNSFSNPVLF